MDQEKSIGVLLRCFVFSALLCIVLTPVHAATRTVLVLGDSLSSAYRIPTYSGWVYLLQQRLQENQYDWKVVNASVSGSTTKKGRARLPDLISEYRPDIVVLELGANDGLRRLPLEQMKQNLTTMVNHAKVRGARVLLVGLRLPPEYEVSYAQDFQRVYQEVATEQQVPLLPFILHNVDNDPGLFQPDLRHPTADAQPRLLDNVWSKLKELLETPSDFSTARQH